MAETPTLTDRLIARRAAPAEDETDVADDCGAYGCLRGRDRSLMLDLRFLDGNRESFPYALLERIRFDPSDGIRLRFLGVEVRLRGRNLAVAQAGGPSLLDGLHRHRVAWVREVEDLHGRFYPADAAAVTRIEVTDGR